MTRPLNEINYEENNQKKRFTLTLHQAIEVLSEEGSVSDWFKLQK